MSIIKVNNVQVFNGTTITITATDTNTSSTLNTGGDVNVTGAITVTDAATTRSNLGLAVGTNVQQYNSLLDDLSALAVTDGNFIVGDGSNFVVESGSTARTSLGLGSLATASTVNLTSETTGTLAVVSGGTGVTALSSLDVANLGSGSATLNHVLAADGAGGLAFQASSGGGISEADAIAFAIAL